MKIIRRNFLLLLVLFTLFLAPAIAAYFFYCNPELLAEKGTNKGELLTSPFFMPELKKNPAKWSLVLWSPDACKHQCAQKLDELARVRLALGRYLYEINIVLLMTGKSKPDPQLLATMREEGLDLMKLKSAKLPVFSRIYIADPEGFLVLSYSIDANPKDIYHDIKRLVARNG